MVRSPTLMYAICVVIWGTTWLAIKEGFATMPPFFSASLRFFVAGAVFVALAATRPRPTWTRGHVAAVAFTGIVFFAGEYGLLYWGEQFLPSGLTAVLFATLPLHVGLLGLALLPAERWTPWHSLGAALGFGGVVLVSGPDVAAGGPVWPSVAVVASAFAAGIGTIVVRRFAHDLDPVWLNAGAMPLGAATLLATAAVAGEPLTLPTEWSAWWSVLYLAVFGSVVTFLLYFRLLQAWSAARSSTIALVIPVVALGVGAVARGEALTPASAAGVALVVAGVAVFLRAAAAAEAPRAPREPQRPEPSGAQTERA